MTDPVDSVDSVERRLFEEDLLADAFPYGLIWIAVALDLRERREPVVATGRSREEAMGLLERRVLDARARV